MLKVCSIPYVLKRDILAFLHQGVFLASNLQHIIRATIDCHASLDVSDHSCLSSYSTLYASLSSEIIKYYMYVSM
jgi:hypothetical protein